MSHSKRNTSLAFFTSYERSLLKNTWGSQSTRLNRDSFLPFSACRLCLLPSRDPVACARNGDFFCRECAVSDLLAQRKEIKRLEKEGERQRADQVEDGRREDDEAKMRAVEEFERVQMGLERPTGAAAAAAAAKGMAAGSSDETKTADELEEPPRKEKKRKFELDEDELLRIAKEERNRAKKALHEEKAEASRSHLPSFWVPSLTPSSNTSTALHGVAHQPKRQPVCPASAKDQPHAFSLKTLVTVHFSEEKDDQTGELVRSCPSCKRVLGKGMKAVLTTPCGHVICKACVDKFMTPAAAAGAPDPHGTPAPDHAHHRRCFVCDTDLGPSTVAAAAAAAGTEKKKTKEKDKDRIRPGMVEIAGEGTGFAGGGRNLIKKEGVAFQC
ncbi:MAG: hypothetical protein M1826_002092 [Phylliscum demangeonii]|nr:MAG: hypothetical protein M1826_002092 [Phylliscum demangeonii]